MFAVLDGHGIDGHHCSEFIAKDLPMTLEFLAQSGKVDYNFLSDPIDTLRTGISNAFLKSDMNLNFEPFDTDYSGTTCVSAFVCPDRIITANLGDSRAVLGRQNLQTKRWEVCELTRDHKPDLMEERLRIEKHGRVFPFKDSDGQPIGPWRVWKKDEDVPGLAMSRSFGDKIAHDAGVISTPEILEYRRNKAAYLDAFIVLASDGLWDFVSNEKVLKIIREHYLTYQHRMAANHKTGLDPEEAVAQLVDLASDEWNSQEPSRDDITCIVIYLQ